MGAWGVAGLLGVWLAAATGGDAQPRAGAGAGVGSGRSTVTMPMRSGGRRTERRRPSGTSRRRTHRGARARARGMPGTERRGQRAKTPLAAVDGSAARPTRPTPGRLPEAGPRLPPGLRPVDSVVPGNTRALEALPASAARGPSADPGLVAPARSESLPSRIRTAEQEEPDASGLEAAAARAGTAGPPDGPAGTPATRGPVGARTRAPDPSGALNGDTRRTGTRAPDPSAAPGSDAARTRARAPDPSTALTGGTRRTGTRDADLAATSSDGDDDPDTQRLAAGPPPLPWALVHALAFERELSVDGFRVSPAPVPSSRPCWPSRAAGGSPRRRTYA